MTELKKWEINLESKLTIYSCNVFKPTNGTPSSIKIVRWKMTCFATSLIFLDSAKSNRLSFGTCTVIWDWWNQSHCNQYYTAFKWRGRSSPSCHRWPWMMAQACLWNSTTLTWKQILLFASATFCQVILILCRDGAEETGSPWQAK